jgi:hypothetical protein
MDRHTWIVLKIPHTANECYDPVGSVLEYLGLWAYTEFRYSGVGSQWYYPKSIQYGMIMHRRVLLSILIYVPS